MVTRHMRKYILIAASVVFGALTASCVAQNESLLIGPGDLIQVDVMDTPEMQQQVRVTDDGTVPLAYIGSIHLAGQTPATASSIIQRALVDKKVMQKPQVTVRVQEYATQDVSVLGEVHTPGTYAITTPQTILKVLALAGGLMGSADRHVTVKRHDSPEQLTYYVSNDAQEALSDVVMVYPGDTVLVSRAPVVYVMGDVNRPGAYAIVTNDARLSIMQAIAQAGSASKTSERSRVRLLRTTAQGQTELPVRLDAIEKGKQPDIVLQPNDIIYVPFSWMKNVAMNSSAIAASTAGAAVYAVQ
jgi:polysaccharide export outer membrane protein